MAIEGYLQGNKRIEGEIAFESVRCEDIICPFVMTRVQGKKKIYFIFDRL